jgi:hypothetical protein
MVVAKIYREQGISIYNGRIDLFRLTPCASAIAATFLVNECVSAGPTVTVRADCSKFKESQKH